MESGKCQTQDVRFNDSPKYRSCLRKQESITLKESPTSRSVYENWNELCSMTLQSIGVGIQNGKNVNGEWIRDKCYVLRVTVLLLSRSCRTESPEYLSQSESATPERFCTQVVQIVQNEKKISLCLCAFVREMVPQ